MEIGAASLTALAYSAEMVAPANRQPVRDTARNATVSNAAVADPGNAATARDDRRERAAEADGVSREMRTANGQAEASRRAVGEIRFEYEDDNQRVMRLYDSKDVLIYQVPPKGELFLVRAQEKAAESRLETSA